MKTNAQGPRGIHAVRKEDGKCPSASATAWSSYCTGNQSNSEVCGPAHVGQLFVLCMADGDSEDAPANLFETSQNEMGVG